MDNYSFSQIMLDVLQRDKSFRFCANGISMSPFIRDGDIITISPICGLVAIGDVIVVLTEKKGFFVHRIIGINKDNFVIKGDNREEIDGEYPRKLICGVVTKVERNTKIVKLGFGPEKLAIALLSRGNILRRVVHHTSRIIKLPHQVVLWHRQEK